MIPVATLRALVEVKGVPKGLAELQAVNDELEKVARNTAIATLGTDVETKGFTEFAALVDEAKGRSAVAELGARVSKSEFAAAEGAMSAIRAFADKGATQKVDVEIDRDSLSSLRGELERELANFSLVEADRNSLDRPRRESTRALLDEVDGLLNSPATAARAARPSERPSPTPSPALLRRLGIGHSEASPINQQTLTLDMFAERQWQRAHPNFWNIGAPTAFPSSGSSAGGSESSIDTTGLVAQTAADAAVRALSDTQKKAASDASRGAYDAALVSAMEKVTQRGAPWSVARSLAKGEPEVVQVVQGNPKATRDAAIAAEMWAAHGRGVPWSVAPQVARGKVSATQEAAVAAASKRLGRSLSASESHAIADAAAADIASGASSGGGGGGFWGSLLGGMFGGGGGGGGWGKKLLWGSGGRLPFLGALPFAAGMGSLGAFAGLGAEHWLFTGMGLAGSAMGAMGGGALIGAGALGQIGVGGGSNIAVTSSAIADTKQLYKAKEALNEAEAKYGPHSKQAREALKELNFLMQHTLGGTKGVTAELKVAEHLSGLNVMWDKKTGPARVKFSHIAEGDIGVAEAYLPKVAHAASMNLGIIDHSLKPLFAWLRGPEGMGIFENLERKFKENLPVAMHAFDQGVEVVGKTINAVQKYTGGFTEEINKLLTMANSPEGFAKWEGEISNLVKDFDAWKNLIVEAGRDLYDMFSQDAHTGRSIVEALTEMLHKAGEWERSTSGKSQLQNIFLVHREEVLQLLRLLPLLTRAFMPLYMTVAPPLVRGLTAVVRVFANLMTALENTSPIFTWGAGLGLIGVKLGLLRKPFAAAASWLWAPFKALLAKMPLIGGMFAEEESATDKLIGATEGLTTAVDNLTASYEAAAAAAGGLADAGAAAGATMGGASVIGAAGEGAAMDQGIRDAVNGAGIGEGITGGLGAGAFASSALASTIGQGLAVGVAGYFAADIGAHLVEKVTGSHFLEGQGLYTSLSHGFNTSGVAQTEEKALARAHNREKAITYSEGPLRDLKSGYVVELGEINELVLRGSQEAAKVWGKGMPGWRRASAEDMHAAIGAIKAGEAQGVIAVEEGNKRIAALLHSIRLVTGNDPFGIARSFTRSWEEAGGANRAGIAKTLDELRQMPPQMRAIAIQMELAQVRQAEKTGTLMKGSYARLRGSVVAEFGLMAVEGGEKAKLLGINVVNAYGHMNSLVAAALNAIGGNTAQALKILGGAKLPAFQLKGNVSTKGVGAVWQAYGESHGKTPGHATGGYIDSPTYMVGEEAPAHPEWVIATNPAYRQSNLGYWAQAGRDLGVPGFAKGGSPSALTEPHITGGAGALRDVGQSAIHDAYKAALRYLDKHRPKAGASVSGLNVPNGPIEQMAREMVERVWGKNEWGPFSAVEMREAGWNPHAQNPASTAYGLAQNLNPSTYPVAGRPGSTAPILDQAKAQLEWMVSYIKGRYGTPAGAWAHEQSVGWYRKGGRVGYAPGGPVGVHSLWKHWGAQKSEAQKALEWEERHLGDTYDYGLPNAWCGAFQAAAMRAAGLAPPGGYDAAASWGGYGKALSRSNIVPGAIIDYDGQHVAMAINSSEMIQGDTAQGNVGTSAIAGEVNGSPITAVRWPYTEAPGAGSPLHAHIAKMITGSYLAHKAGATSTGGGTYAEAQYAHYRAYTAKIHLPSGTPKSLQDCEREIAERRGQIKEYRAAAQRTHGATHRAIEVNIHALEARLRKLYSARHRLRLEKAKHGFHRVLARQMRGLTGFEDQIAGAERLYNIANERAQQIVDLEPQLEGEGEGAEKTYAAKFGAYVEGSERPAYEAVLGTEAGWRNTILAAESQAVGLERGWEAETRKVVESIKRINALTKSHDAKWWHDPKHAADLKRREALRSTLPYLRYKEKELRSAIGQARGDFWPGIHGHRPVSPPVPPLAGTGSLEESLIGVQGVHWPGEHSPLGASALAGPRIPGVFGGAIWETQTAIAELALKVRQATSGLGGSGGESEHETLLRELLTQANQRQLIAAAQSAVTIPYAGPYAAGGTVAALVGETGPEVATFRPGTRISSAAETRNLLSNSGEVEVHVHGDILSDDPNPIRVKQDERELDARIRKVHDEDGRRRARGANRRHPPAGVFR